MNAENNERTETDGVPPTVRATMSVKSFCQASTLCKSTAHKLIRTGKLEATTVGTRRLIYVDSAQALLSPPVGKGA